MSLTDREIEQDNEKQQELRAQAINRQTTYNHPEISLTRHPINAKQALELSHKLKGLIVTKMEQVRRLPDSILYLENYEDFYAKNFQMNARNEAEDRQACRDIQEMHNIADMLMNPPKFQAGLQLYRKQMPTYSEAEQTDKIFSRYQEAYKDNDKVEDTQAEDAIKRAKRFLVKNSDQ